jgi:hypothetical protein
LRGDEALAHEQVEEVRETTEILSKNSLRIVILVKATQNVLEKHMKIVLLVFCDQVRQLGKLGEVESADIKLILPH